jgi:hypothetical protein
MTQLSPALIARIKERAADPEQRSDASALSASSVDLGSLLGSLGGGTGAPPGLPPELQKAFGALSSLGIFGNIQVMAPPIPGAEPGAEAKREAAPLPGPCSDADIAEAEASLGFALPEALKQLYVEVGDGGYGRGDGLYPLDRLVAKYRLLTSEPQGPQGQQWPAELLPINGDDWELVCINRETGALIYWDAEELAEGYSNKHWLRSFKPEADSVEAWLGEWLEKPAGHRPLGFPGDYKS